MRPRPVRQCTAATFLGSASSQLSIDVHILKSIPSGGAGCPGNRNSNTYPERSNGESAGGGGDRRGRKG